MSKKLNRLKLPSDAVRLRLEALESREVPATLVGLTTVGSLVTFDSATPNTLIGAPVTITGLAGGETLVGIDYRPSNGTLYGVGSTNRIYTLNTSTGVATTVGAAGAFKLSGTSFGVDFNPIADRIRVVGNTGQNLRLNPIDGTLSGTDTPLAYDPNDDTNRGFFGTVDPNNPLSAANVPANVVLVAAGYTKSLDQVTNTIVTTLYAIDASQDLLVRVGGPNGPQVRTVAKLSLSVNCATPDSISSPSATSPVWTFNRTPMPHSRRMGPRFIQSTSPPGQ